MNISDFKHRITIQTKGTGTDADGYPIEQWVDYKTIWAMVKTLTAKEYVQAKATQTDITTRFVIRFTRDNIDSTMMIKYNGRNFEIIAPPINDNEENITLTIIGREVV